jgi:hypothetical protein
VRAERGEPGTVPGFGFPGRATIPPWRGENGSREEYCGSQDQRMAIGLILNEVWESKMGTPVKTLTTLLRLSSSEARTHMDTRGRMTL